MQSTILNALLRKPGTNRTGGSFSAEMIQAVWNKGAIVPGYDPSMFRKDVCGWWVQRTQYGVTVENGYGWEVDHVVPVAKGGGDDLANLQPLQWQMNRHKGDNFPWSCK